jgi:hypothetical protein
VGWTFAAVALSFLYRLARRATATATTRTALDNAIVAYDEACCACLTAVAAREVIAAADAAARRAW